MATTQNHTVDTLSFILVNYEYKYSHTYQHSLSKNPNIIDAGKRSVSISFNLQMCVTLSSSLGCIVTAVIMPLLPSGVGALPPGTVKSTIEMSGRVYNYCRAR